MMRFAVKQIGAGGERVGNLNGFAKLKNAVIETPTAALLTQGGSVVHLTAEVLSKVFQNPKLLWVPLSNSYQLEAGLRAQGEGVAKFAGLSDHITCASLHNINDITIPGHFQANQVPLWTKNGKKMITASRYMDLMEVFKPDFILTIADGRSTLTDGQKRNTKAIDRTQYLLDSCVKRYKESKQLTESSLIAVITGIAAKNKCDSFIQYILTHKDDLSGIALAGITDGTEESLNISFDVLEDIFKRISDTIPKELVKFVEGCWSPDIVVMAIQYGWDVFDGSYPSKITNTGHALVLNFDVNSDKEELCMLNLNDVLYEDDFKPILEGCECHACKKHTRAYIRHLLNTREMLSTVLLSIHNLHHFDQMFVHARRHIASNTFDVYKRHIIKQYQHYKQHCAAAKTNGVETSEEQIEQNNKKICVSNSNIETVASE